MFATITVPYAVLPMLWVKVWIDSLKVNCFDVVCVKSIPLVAHPYRELIKILDGIVQAPW